MAAPDAFLMTIRTYGTWLHGDARGSDIRRTARKAGHVERVGRLERLMRSAMTQAPFVLDPGAAAIVEAEIIRTCAHEGWALVALNVRSEHVHGVVGAACSPDRIRTVWKAWCTRRLREDGLLPDRKVWSAGGSARWLVGDDELRRAISYVLEQQGRRFATGVDRFDRLPME